MIKISVIIPIYNMEKYLRECLDSVVLQTLKDIEIICVNDGSTDSSEKILRDYQSRHTNLIVVWQENSGSGAARNHGLKLASGEFVAFLDPDDFYPQENTLERLYTTAIEKSVNVCGGSVETFLEGKRVQNYGKLRWGSVFAEEGLISYRDYQYAYGYWRFIYQAKMLKENHIKFPLFRRNQDPPFMVRAMLAAEELYAIPDTVYVVRIVDKKVPVYREDIICDIALGFADMLEISKEHRLEKLHVAILEEIYEKWIEQFYIHIFNGNERLYEILQNMNEYASEKMLDKSSSLLQTPYFMSKADIMCWGEVYRERELGFRQELEPYKEIIIYGAGKVGKEIYDYITALYEEKKVCFAVTDISGEHTARGIKIKKIEEYLSLKEQALVIVAAGKQYLQEMDDRARRLGFENIKAVEKAMIPINKVLE